MIPIQRAGQHSAPRVRRLGSRARRRRPRRATMAAWEMTKAALRKVCEENNGCVSDRLLPRPPKIAFDGAEISAHPSPSSPPRPGTRTRPS